MDRPAGLRAITELDRALLTFLDHPSTFKEFHLAARAHLRRCSRRFGAGLPTDVAAEIVNETMVTLLEAEPGAFDPGRGSAQAFLTFAARHAARRVRARNAAPGQKTRISKQTRDAAQRAAEAETARPRERIDVELDSRGGVRFPGRGGSQALTFGLAEHVEKAVHLDEILANAPPRVRATLEGTHFEDKSLREVAAEMGVNHGTLSREVNAFFQSQRVAA